jgi:HTH-type transcriptional regulator/antitoxin HigA
MGFDINCKEVGQDDTRMDKSKRTYNPDIAIPPGESLQEILNSIGMTQRELANRMNLSPESITKIISGTKSITPDIANRLHKVLQISAKYWLNLEKNYQITKSNLS